MSGSGAGARVRGRTEVAVTGDEMAQVEVVVFDLGNVLNAWDPRHLYRKLFDCEHEMEWFLAHVCTSAWNLEQDRGRRWTEAVAERIALFPEHESLIRVFDERWHEMVPGAIDGSVAILEDLAAADVPLYAVTNFSSEKFREYRARFRFVDRFRDIVVSGDVGLLKPDPAIYRLLLDRHRLEADRAVFIDDSPANVEGARAVGMHALRFTGPEALRLDLRALGLPV